MMSSKAKSGSCVSPESIKVISESIGITNLGDDGAKDLGEDATYRLKELIQESFKFMQHGKRRKITTDDFDRAIKLKNIEPVYGFQNLEFIPFRFTSGGGRELYFNEEKEIDLNEFVNSSMPKLPLEPTLKAHWLSIEGIQPTVPENPPPISKDQQKNESIDPLSALKRTPGNKVLQVGGKNKAGKSNVPSGPTKHIETVKIKQLATHELSVEQQLYYKEITEACVGSDESRRAEALQSLSSDPGLHQMLPRLCTFVAEGVKVNVVQNNLALLIYLMRMVKALLENQTLYLEKYLHELIPSVGTCIVSKQLCMRPDVDNHWALRDFAARLMAQICKRKWTWEMPGNRAKNQLDYILVNRHTNLTNVEVLNRVTGSDHRMVRATICINVKSDRTKLIMTRHIPVVATQEQVDQYRLELTNSFQVLAVVDEDQANSQLIKTMRDAAKKANPTCNQSLNKFSATTLSLMNRRNDLIIRNSEDLLEKRDLNKTIHRRQRTETRAYVRTRTVFQTLCILLNFNTSTNGVQTRVSRMFSSALKNDKFPLSCHYGAIVGLHELGPELVKVFVLPRLKAVGERIRICVDGPFLSSIDKIAAEHMKQLMVKVLAPVLKSIRNPPDNIDEYKTDFGYFGNVLHAAVVRLRSTPISTASTRTISSVTPVNSLISHILTVYFILNSHRILHIIIVIILLELA
ncbi:Transcription initiation factor TFIID subunit 6 [Nymphon striatum]|nr:Transcription initiation factor TFIID subunit 6 [Nymphon striatum]